MRILVVDDSTVFRKVVRDTLAGIPGVEIVGVSRDGRSALEQIKVLRPDVVTLDVEMPVMNGIEVLRTLRTADPHPHVIMLSALTGDGAAATTQALRLGAFDFVLKPTHASMQENCKQLRDDLLPKINALLEREKRRQPRPRPRHQETATFEGHTRNSQTFPQTASTAKVIAIGISTGGPAALGKLLPRLPKDFPAPLLIVQHMPPMFTQSLAEELDRACQITVCEASSGQTLQSGHAYIAPGGKQMKVGRVGLRNLIRVTNDPPESNCQPSVNYLFRSVANQYGRYALGLVMTGMGDDGTLGCRLLKRTGATIVAQDSASCVVYGMPRQVVEANLADMVCSLDQLPDVLTAATHSQEVTR